MKTVPLLPSRWLPVVLSVQVSLSSMAVVAGQIADFRPGFTLADDLRDISVEPKADYQAQHPRLLFFGEDRDVFQKRSKDEPIPWNAVITHANELKEPPPDAEVIETGVKYWRAEFMESGALAWFVTGEPAYRQGSINFMKAYCAVDTWGTGFRPNLDLQASWYLYHISIAYDILYNELEPADRRIIEEGLAHHAHLIYDDYASGAHGDEIRYDQNHTYIPMTALAAASLVLYGDVAAAEQWLNLATAVLRRSRYVQSEDGYYYEGFGYWSYALHWQVRGAELLARATGESLFELPAIRNTWMNALYLSLPGSPGVFDVGDTGVWSEGRRGETLVNNQSMMWSVASATRSGESQTAGNYFTDRKPDVDYPAAAFLWFEPSVVPVPFDEIPRYHYFADHDVVSWRSSWDDDATCVLFRCGPPLGHAATGKIGQLKDWLMNCGHVHPDIGAFWLYAKGEYLAVDTGYLARKWTEDHNTLLIDGKGQGMDGSYWNERGIPYENFDNAKIDAVEMTDRYFFVSGEFGSAYSHQVKGVTLRRTLVGTRDWLFVYDQMQSESAHELTWICHADVPFVQSGDNYIATLSEAALAVIPLLSENLKTVIQPTMVEAGRGPQKATPEQRGYEIRISNIEPSKNVVLANLLTPLAPETKPPTVRFDRGNNQLQLEVGTGAKVAIRLNAEHVPQGVVFRN